MEAPNETIQRLNRRAFLGRTGLGLVALRALLGGGQMRGAEAIAGGAGGTQVLHHPARVKRVIQLYMSGGPSQLETFDYKPKLASLHGQAMPKSVTSGQPLAQLQPKENELKCFGPQHGFRRFGKSGQEISEILPETGGVADDIAIVRSMVTDAINHDPANTLMNTGSTISGRPAMGSWVTYGLGSEAEDLPGFVVLTSTGAFGQTQPISSRYWHSGFLPSRLQGVQFRSQGAPVLYLNTPRGITAGRQHDMVEAVTRLNQLQNRVVEDPEIAARIAQYEMAFRMQTSVPALMDISKEPKSILDLYGTPGGDGSFAANCLLARRLAERGVRFVQLYHRDWDHHSKLKVDIQGVASEVDRGSAALIKDLKQRGMLDDTLVIWGGEFGRTPMAQDDGRDHHIKGFSIWLAGGGIRGGTAYGRTDELGYQVVENKVHVNDLHATILHLLGIDHQQLTYRAQGRDFRLTDVGGEIVKGILT